MKKRIHWFAIALWLVAIILFVSQLASLYWQGQFWEHTANIDSSYPQAVVHMYTVSNVWNGFRTALLASAELAALGFAIEILDQIRWLLTRPRS